MTKRPEAALVADIRSTLERLGYEVAVTGQRNAKGSGTTVGFPDMAVRQEDWQAGLWLLLEVKAKGGKPSPEQFALMIRGGSHIVFSVADALRSVARIEHHWGYSDTTQKALRLEYIAAQLEDPRAVVTVREAAP